MNNFKGTFEVGYISRLGFSGTFKVAETTDINKEIFNGEMKQLMRRFRHVADVKDGVSAEQTVYGRKIFMQHVSFRPLNDETLQKELYSAVLEHLRSEGWKIK